MVKSYRDISVNEIWGGYPFIHNCKGFQIQCDEFLKKLSDRCMSLVSILSEKIIEMHRLECDGYELSQHVTHPLE